MDVSAAAATAVDLVVNIGSLFGCLLGGFVIGTTLLYFLIRSK